MIHLVMASDENYMRHMAVASLSAMINTKETISFYALCNNVSDESKRKLADTLKSATPKNSVTFIDLDPTHFDGLKRSRYISVTMFARYFIPDVLPADVHKALYTDTDTLLRHDISELYHTDISDYPVAAVHDLFMEKKYHRRHYIPKEVRAFNSGVMLINLDSWRETRFHEKAVEYAVKNGMNDQITLNVLINGKWRALDYKWNMVSGYYRRYYNYVMNKLYPFPFANVTERIKDPYILHTTGSKKLSDYSYKYLFAEEYFRYLDMTPWRGYKPTDKNILTACDRVYNRVRIKIIDMINR